LDSAVAIFEERGYVSSTVDEIAAAAGASRATFYLHFSSKADIVRALYAEVEADIAEYYSRLDEIFANGSRGDFRGWLKDALDWFDRNRTVVHAFDMVIASGDPVSAEKHYTYADYMPNFLNEWPEERHVEARTRVRLLVVLVSSVHRLWREQGRMEGVSETLMIDLLQDMGAAALSMLPRSDESPALRPVRPQRSKSKPG
jgi:AcrR family transcriptional regulator